MGDRGQVMLEYRNGKTIYLYTHWSATELAQNVREALAKKERWDDDEYLARIIFCQMLKNGYKTPEEALNDCLSYGISTIPHSDIWREVKISLPDQTVEVISSGYGDVPDKTLFKGTFAQFVETDKPFTEEE